MTSSYGDAGADTLSGNGGARHALRQRRQRQALRRNRHRLLDGGAGNDYLSGGRRNDLLQGGTGKDVLIGDAGADDFVFKSVGEAGKGSARDVIRDFSRAQGDDIDLSAIDANTKAAGNQAFSFIGGQGLLGKGRPAAVQERHRRR